MSEDNNTQALQNNTADKYIDGLLNPLQEKHVLYRTLLKWDKPGTSDHSTESEAITESTAEAAYNHTETSSSMDKIKFEPEVSTNSQQLETIEDTPYANAASQDLTTDDLQSVITLRDAKDSVDSDKSFKPDIEIVSSAETTNKKDKKQKKKKKKVKESKTEVLAPEFSAIFDDKNPQQFLNWLKNMKALQGSQLEKKQKKKSKIQQIIDKSIEEPVGIVSESYALVLAKQGHKDKAIEMFRQLILKNPEKSSYFAAQIEKIKK